MFSSSASAASTSFNLGQLLPLAVAIGVLHLPQLQCHAGWATRTPENSINETTTTTTSTTNGMQIQTMQVNCSRELLEMHLELSRPFRGLLYAKDFPLECRARGKDSTRLHLRIPTSGCGVRAEPLEDGSLEYTVRVMLQKEQKLRQSTDILSSVRCQLPPNAMGMPLPVLRREKGHDRNARMRALAAAALPALAATSAPPASGTQQRRETPRVRIWLELGGPNGTGSVEVGVATTLTVRAVVPGNIGVRVVDCAALDGLGESTQQLLDARGCPIDEQLNCRLKTPPPALSAEQHLARIEVFNSLAVTAPQIEVDRLRYDRRHNMSGEDYAPHVRAQSMPGEGTLCLSISKLAISFCVLGLIFLVAVVVAIFSLIRSRRRERRHGTGLGLGLGLGIAGTSTSNSSSRLHRDRAEICTSMFSSSSESAQSQPRFGAKFLMPYYPNTLPYGRVY
ncbi:uncharacterized protein LOC122624723 isoform X2 [Drosophila teissieri]|uniref:uncharacterized protein LOC122624723 isoform X2 n=1 Tax=Drosophila teissieri TaxID=7243 RepID=UPI001CBA5BE6|nr:uncharacterized protein LOC122624723 isoform X2 [Drosophila teissieri]